MIAWRHSNRRGRSLRARHSGAVAGVVETTLHMQLTESAYPRRRPAFGEFQGPVALSFAGVRALAGRLLFRDRPRSGGHHRCGRYASSGLATAAKSDARFRPQARAPASGAGRPVLGDCTSGRLELPPGFRRALSQKALVRTCRRAMPMPHSDAGRVLSVGCERLEEAAGRPKRALALWR